MEDAVYIYTDGACSGNPGAGGWAAVLIFPDGRLTEIGGYAAETTNNRMEMTAAAAALEKAAGRREKIVFYSDSSLLINGITGWIYGWLKRNWINGSGQPVANRDLWERVYSAARGFSGRIEWKHVKGHAGHEINERCDRIAVSFSRRTPLKLYDGPIAGCGYSVLAPAAGAAVPRVPSSLRVHVPDSAVKKYFYVSVVGGKTNYHQTWNECRVCVSGVPGAKFKKFVSRSDSEEWLKGLGFPVKPEMQG
jgi:Ribonuclease HI